MGCIRKGYLKKETEGLIFAAQEQALKVNWIRRNIDGQEIFKKCGMYGEKTSQSLTLLQSAKS